MRFVFLTVALAFLATPAFAADIISCNYNMPASPPAPEPPPPASDLGSPPLPPPAPPAAPAAVQPQLQTAPTVLTRLDCSYRRERMDLSLWQLSEQGWRLQTTVNMPGSITFYLIK
jgi:hypothetical protein